MSDRQPFSLDDTLDRTDSGHRESDFESYVSHYASLKPDQLLQEARLLFGHDGDEIRFDAIAGRLNALLVSLVNCAANASDMTDHSRSKIVTLAIYLDAYLTRKADADGSVTVASVLSATLEGVRLFGLFPIVADLVENQITDYVGTYEETAVSYE